MWFFLCEFWIDVNFVCEYPFENHVSEHVNRPKNQESGFCDLWRFQEGKKSTSEIHNEIHSEVRIHVLFQRSLVARLPMCPWETPTREPMHVENPFGPPPRTHAPPPWSHGPPPWAQGPPPPHGPTDHPHPWTHGAPPTRSRTKNETRKTKPPKKYITERKKNAKKLAPQKKKHGEFSKIRLPRISTLKNWRHSLGTQGWEFADYSRVLCSSCSSFDASGT